jgi:hypothetical protein
MRVLSFCIPSVDEYSVPATVTGSGTSRPDIVAQTAAASTVDVAEGVEHLTTIAATDVTDKRSAAMSDPGIASFDVTIGPARASSAESTDTAFMTLNVSGADSVALAPAASSNTGVNVTGGAGETIHSDAYTTLTSADTGIDFVSISIAATF